MLEKLDYLLYHLDFIDLNILEQIIANDYSITLDRLVTKLKRINVWNKGTIRNRIIKLRKEKIVYFEDRTIPLIIEIYQHKEKEVVMIKELLKKRLIG